MVLLLTSTPLAGCKMSVVMLGGAVQKKERTRKKKIDVKDATRVLPELSASYMTFVEINMCDALLLQA